MKAKNVFLFLVLLLVALPVYIWAGTQLRANRSPEKAGFRLRDLPLPVNFYRVAAGEFSGLSADFLYLNIAAALGGRGPKTMRDADWDRIQKAFEVATGLDVYFEPTFRAIQAFLTWDAKRPEAAIALLKPVSEQRSWHWLPTFFIGFDYYFFLKDNAEASRYFQQAAERPEGPSLLATLAARLAAETGNAAAGIDFLQRMMATAEDEEERETYRKRIEALEGVQILQNAVALYRRTYGVNPPFLEALLIVGYVTRMPKNPYHPTYFYLNGVVRFDPFPTKGVYEGTTYEREEAPRPSPLLPLPVP